VTAVDEVNLKVSRGQTLGIVGESGSGKSTILRMMLRLIRPTRGRVLFNGTEIWSLRGEALNQYRRQVQAVFQDPMSSFNPRQSIGTILAAPLEVHGLGPQPARTETIEQTLALVGLHASHARRFPHQLSGGQRQRVAIARAIILRPAVVLADEPTSALDVSVQAQILNLFKVMKAELSLTYVFVSHNLAVVRYLSDEIAVMHCGRIVEAGRCKDVFLNPQHDYTRTLLRAVPDIPLDAQTAMRRID
jgi:peptide/nickel transport system ATP-binding protein